MNIRLLNNQAKGQWVSIIASLTGVELTYNKHTPCPICGGRDRFRFDDKDGRGTYICNQCGAGDGLALLSKIQGSDIATTAHHVSTFLGMDTQIHEPRKGTLQFNKHYINSKQTTNRKNGQKEEDKTHTNNHATLPTDQLKETILGVAPYFTNKGLSYPTLMKGETALVPLITIKGKVTAIQSIQADGTKKFRKGDIKKGSFYMVLSSHKQEEHLCFDQHLPTPINTTQENLTQTYKNQTFIISEGVATAVTTKLFIKDAFCIAAIDVGNLLSVAKIIREQYPLARIIIAADNDCHLTKNKGIQIAQKAASIIGAEVAIPPIQYKADWNDLYQEQGRDKTTELFHQSLITIEIDILELSDGTPLNTDELQRLKEINKQYTQVILPDGGLIYSKRFDQATGAYILKHEKLNAFTARFDHYPPIAKKNAARAWLKWGGKQHKSDGVGFYPDKNKCPDTVLNLFDGFAIEPKQGDCDLYLNHIKQVLCSGEIAAYECFIAWLAHLIQKPDQKPSFAVVMTSEQGAGKGISIQPLLQIMGGFGVYENGIERITGRFNSTIANKLLAFIDEVHIERQRDADSLKSLISETIVNLEQKGIDPIQIPSYTRFIFASNRIDAIKAGIRERRYLVLNVSNEYAQDKGYFDQLGQWLNNKGAAYLLDYLLHYDISQFDHRRAVQTDALKTLITTQLTGVEGFIYEQLLSDNPFNHLANMGRIESKEVINSFIEWSKENGQTITKASARSTIGKIFNGLGAEQEGNRQTGLIYHLPQMDLLKLSFAKKLQIKFDDLFFI